MSMEPIAPEEEKRLMAYILERDWLEPVKPLWHPDTSMKSCAFVAPRTGKSTLFDLQDFNQSSTDISRLNDCNKYDRFQAGRRQATATFLVPAPHTFSKTALAAAGPPPRLDWWGISPSGRKGLSLKHSSGCKVKVNDDNECVYVITNDIYPLSSINLGQ